MRSPVYVYGGQPDAVKPESKTGRWRSLSWCLVLHAVLWAIIYHIRRPRVLFEKTDSSWHSTESVILAGVFLVVIIAAASILWKCCCAIFARLRTLIREVTFILFVALVAVVYVIILGSPVIVDLVRGVNHLHYFWTHVIKAAVSTSCPV
jgi:hypothetical protein